MKGGACLSFHVSDVCFAYLGSLGKLLHDVLNL